MLRLHFVYVAFSTVVKLVGAIIPGVVISRFLGAPIKSEQGFSFITLRIFLSCMLFANLCHDVSPSLLKSYFWAVVMSLVPMILGILSSLFVRKMVPQEWRVLLVLGSTFQNGLAFPLSVVSNIKGVSWLDQKGITVCQQYVFLYNLTCALGLWSIGSLMVKHYKDKLIEKHEEMLEDVYFDELNEQAARAAQQAYASAMFGAPLVVPEEDFGGGVVPPPNTPYLTPFSRGWSEIHDDFTASVMRDTTTPISSAAAAAGAMHAVASTNSIIMASPFSRNGSLSRMGTDISFSSGVLSPLGGLRMTSPQESISFYRPCRRHPRPIDLRKYKRYVENGEELPSSKNKKNKKSKRKARPSRKLSITASPETLSSIVPPSSFPPYVCSCSSSRTRSRSLSHSPSRSRSLSHSPSRKSADVTLSNKSSRFRSSSCSCSRDDGNVFAQERMNFHDLGAGPLAIQRTSSGAVSLVDSDIDDDTDEEPHPPPVASSLKLSATIAPSAVGNRDNDQTQTNAPQEDVRSMGASRSTSLDDKRDSNHHPVENHHSGHGTHQKDQGLREESAEQGDESACHRYIDDQSKPHDRSGAMAGVSSGLNFLQPVASADVASSLLQHSVTPSSADIAPPEVPLNTTVPFFATSSNPNDYTPAPDTEDLEMHLRDRSLGVRLQHVWEMVKFVLQTPPITLSLIGIVVALVPPFRWLASTAVGAAIIGGFEVIGTGCVPVQLITLGIILSPNNIKVDTNVVPSPGMNDPGGEEEERKETEARDLAAARMGTTFGFLLLPFRWLRRMWQRISPAVRLSILCLSLRLFILPAFAFFIVHVLVETGIMPSDKLFVFAILIGISSPAAVNASLVCTMHSYYPRQFAKMILTMYCVAALTSTFWISVSITYANHME